MLRLSLLFTLLLVLVSFVSLSQTLSRRGELDLTRLTSAIYPYRNEIRAKWTRRATTTAEESQGTVSCHLCNAVMPILRNWATVDSKEELKTMVIRACKSLELAPRPEICEPIISAYTDQFLYIIANTTAVNSSNPNPSAQICNILTPDCDHAELNFLNITMDTNKPEIKDREILTATTSLPTTKILQFTDIHMDLDYVEGANTDCGPNMPICCRNDLGGPTDNVSLQAGPYGDFLCALPLNTLKILLEDAKTSHSDARYVFLTGDYIHSGVWLYSKAENGRHISNVTQAFVEAFPDKNVVIYPVVGNHEPQVVNMYPPPEVWEYGTGEFDLNWMYTAVMKPFSERDPNFLEPEEFERFMVGGYYSATPEIGLRIIVVNTNLCYGENFWLGYSPYPLVRTHLQWFADELKAAESKGENVLIVGHQEPGDCYAAWSDKFNELVDRYEGIIRGSFFGHSHKPQYRISMKKGTMTPVFSGFIAGSTLPDRMHPSYSVWHVDGERNLQSYWDVLRHELYVLNLTESNALRVPVITKLTDSYDQLGLDNLRPDSILKFAQKLICDQALLDRYLTFHSKGDDTLDHTTCKVGVPTSTCVSDIVCNIVQSNAADKTACQELEKVIKETRCGMDGNAAFQNHIEFGGVFIITCITLVLNIYLYN